MSDARRFDDQIIVAGQIDPSDVAALAAQGIDLIVNNRPDGEDADQPHGADIERAAKTAGIAYAHVPIARGIGPSDVEDMSEALERSAGGKVFAFCRTGNRSSLVSALARRKQGVDAEEVVRRLRQSGGDPAPIAHLL